MSMYIEQSITGINIIDMSEQHLRLIRDSLHRAVRECDLDIDEKLAIATLIERMDAIIYKIAKHSVS